MADTATAPKPKHAMTNGTAPTQSQNIGEMVPVSSLIADVRATLARLEEFDQSFPGAMVPRSMGGGLTLKPGTSTVPAVAKPAPVAAPVATAPKPKHTPAAPVAAPVATAAPAPAPAAAPVEKTGQKRNYTNDKSLNQTVFEILDRPENGKGLKISDIVATIEKEGEWKSSAPDISNMVSGAVYKLRGMNLLARGDNRTYFVPEGASWPNDGAADGDGEGDAGGQG